MNKESNDPIIPAYNTPEHKFNIGFRGRDLSIKKFNGIGFNVNYKWIEGFIFEGLLNLRVVFLHTVYWMLKLTRKLKKPI